MSEACRSSTAAVVPVGGERASVVRGLTKWLSLAAAPTFAIMALLTALAVDGSAGGLCSTETFPLGGMVPMYLLMSAFHLSPWLRLIPNRQGV